ncbi:MAG: hypothetical protein II081_08310, partial [Prevotella sp.]|nr:hypothetical protein [Prevotella sp.]
FNKSPLCFGIGDFFVCWARLDSFDVVRQNAGTNACIADAVGISQNARTWEILLVSLCFMFHVS